MRLRIYDILPKNFSRQRRKQIEYRENGLCMTCGKKTKINPHTDLPEWYCPKHKKYQRDYRNGIVPTYGGRIK